MTTTQSMSKVRIDRLPKGGEWTPAYNATITREPARRFYAPKRYSLAAAATPPDALLLYERGLAELGVSDPTECTAAMTVARKHHADRKRLTPADSDGTQLAAAYRAGQLTPSELVEGLARVSAERQAEALSRAKQIVDQAAVDAQTRARRALYAMGDQLITDVLRPIVTDVLKQAAKSGATPELQRRWDLAHEIAAALRGWAVDTVEGTPADYMFARPDLVHLWRCDRARYADEVFRVEVGNEVRIALTPVDGPEVTLADIVDNADEWQPGLCTAAEVVENARGWVTL